MLAPSPRYLPVVAPSHFFRRGCDVYRIAENLSSPAPSLPTSDEAAQRGNHRKYEDVHFMIALLLLFYQISRLRAEEFALESIGKMRYALRW